MQKMFPEVVKYGEQSRLNVRELSSEPLKKRAKIAQFNETNSLADLNSEEKKLQPLEAR